MTPPATWLPEPEQPEARRPWYRKKRYLIPIGVIVALTIIGSVGGGEDPKPASTATARTTVTTTATATVTATTKVTATTRVRATTKVTRTITVKRQPKVVQPAPVRSVKPKPVPSCMSGYSPCLPVTTDLNCSDVSGPVTVTGDDPYGLDRDGDGVGCDS